MSRDPALTRRIFATLACVLIADLLLVGCVAFLLRPWLAPVASSLPAGSGWLAFVVPATAVLVWAQLRYTRREALSEVDATVVTDETHPNLVARVRRLATGVDVAVPTVAVSEAEVANAFTVGTPRRATVVVSTGLLSALDEDELDAVLAHELAHVKNRDAMVMTLATFLPALAGNYSLLADLGLGKSARRTAWMVAIALLYVPSAAVIDAPIFGVRYTVTYVLLVAFVLLFGGVALGLLAMPVISLAGRLSHDREFVADRAGATLSGSPASMASALTTLADTPVAPDRDARAVDGVKQLCFLSGGFGKGEEDEAGALDSLPISVQTHPAIEDRLAELRDVASELEA
ncbi:M48 family metalloprotease [Haladaptatus sp. AB618]|uniref:M48 family metalloprotease n=1 Tax=Haladaptatus sp. AB618 TaxID=2934173 RepID=UPI00209C68A9|nr:M48 family metalloprotease [Haladaptatus sp. AB618]MCO8255168.1 M48 family metalloprotease [Haladaptatus sp. AB618]